MKYFDDVELACKGSSAANVAEYGSPCGCGGSLPSAGIHPRLQTLLDAIREKVGRPIYVTSAYRCERHNRRVGGELNSYHIQGIAADIHCPGVSMARLAEIAIECGADGVGRYWSQDFTHVDVRGYEARWDE